jgi:hypothetical protein
MCGGFMLKLWVAAQQVLAMHDTHKHGVAYTKHTCMGRDRYGVILTV